MLDFCQAHDQCLLTYYIAQSCLHAVGYGLVEQRGRVEGFPFLDGPKDDQGQGELAENWKPQLLLIRSASTR